MSGEQAPGRPVIPRPVQDAAISIGVALLDLSSGFGVGRQGQHQTVLATALLTAMGLVLYPRRRFPGAVVAAVTALVAVLTALHTSLEAAFIAVLIAFYSAAVYGSRLLTRMLAAAAAAAAVTAVGIPTALGWGGSLGAYSPVRTLLAAAGAWLVGLLVRRQLAARTQHIEALAERAELLAAQQEERAHRATLAERLRIARELHDIVAHHLSVVVIQAQGAQRIADTDLARAKRAMADAERTGRTALEEMRRLLGLLRTGEAESTEPRTGEPGSGYAPSLGLADVDELAARMRIAGLPVTIQRNGEPRDVPEDVGLTVYRIIQESLTNVLRHAGPAAATVQLTFAGDLSVTVTDDGWGAAANLASPGVPGAGRGTTGMRERVAALGGQLTTGPQPGGGFRVQATIPLAGS